MKTLLVISSLTVLGVATAGVAAVADTPAPVRRSVIRAAEISIKQRLSGLFPDMAQSVTGDPRGVYLDGYGAVFTAEMEPVTDGTMMMHAVLRPDEKAAVLAKKKARIPEIRKAMKESLVKPRPRSTRFRWMSRWCWKSSSTVSCGKTAPVIRRS